MRGLLDLADDPASQGLLSLGLRLMSTPGNFGTALGTAGLGAMGDLNQATQAKQRRDLLAQEEKNRAAQLLMQQQQMQQMLDQQAKRQGYLNSVNPDAGPAMPVNPAAAMSAGLNASEIEQLSPAGMKPIIVGDTVLDPRTFTPLYTPPQKPTPEPTSVQEYNYARSQGFTGSFDEWKKGNARAGATQIGMPRIEVKTGDGLAGQVGPMAKDSRTQVQGAVGMFDSADRIQRAIDSGKVSAGPLTTQIQTVKQLIQKVGGGNDDGIRQTRQVMKSLAQMAVEARKELAGQGQITENEAAAVARAEAGDINDLTIGELQDLVTLTKRAAHYRAKSHQEIIDTMGKSDVYRGMIPFYQVRGVERLLEHSPQLPQIGGTPKVLKFDANGNPIK